MLHVINYADGKPFESFRKVCSFTARTVGRADSIVEYTASDIPADYRERHKKIFSYKRGAGLWLWKPYLILQRLEEIAPGDYLIYLDAGITVIRDLHHLTHYAERNGRDLLVANQPLLNRQFTKRECFLLMGIDDHGENQVWGGTVVLRKTERAVRLMREWLAMCENEELLSPKHFREDWAEWHDFVAHREDQSLLSLLCIRHGIEPCRDMSDYGRFPFQYAVKAYTYQPKQYPDCDYPTLLLLNRKVSPLRYLCTYAVKVLLNSLGIYFTEENILRKRGLTLTE